MNPSQPRSLRMVSVLVLVVASLLLTVWGRARLYQMPRDKTARLKEVLMVPPGRVVRQVDLGYHSLAADLLFIRANLYYGVHILSDEQFPWLSSFIDILLEVDPNFKEGYYWGALVTIYYRRKIAKVPDELLRQSNQILERGMKQFPDEYRFPMRIAYNHYYEMGDPDRAIPFFQQAASLPNAPTWLREKLVDIYTKKGQREMAKKTLSELILETDDPMLAQAIRDRMAFLLEESERKELSRRREKLLRDWKSSYGYLPFDLYLLTREQ